MEIIEIVGVDTSKKTFDGHIESKKVHSVFENNKTGFRRFKKWLRQYLGKDLSKVRIVMEHTGQYTYQLEEYLHNEGLSFSKVSGLAIKLSLGLVRGKDDKIDAKRIAEYGVEKRAKLKPFFRPDKAVLRLKSLISLRDKLVNDKAGYMARVQEQQACMDLSDNDILLKVQRSVIDAIEKQVKKLEKEIQQVVHQDETIGKNYDLLTSISGVGPVLATYTIAYTNNFVQCTDARQFACFVGIAPFPYKSGTSIKGKTKVSPYANKKIKSILYMCASTAIQYNEELKSYYEHRLNAGKSPMSTINIIRNKIVHRMFAVIRKQQPYSATIPNQKN
jgi:transposase